MSNEQIIQFAEWYRMWYGHPDVGTDPKEALGLFIASYPVKGNNDEHGSFGIKNKTSYTLKQKLDELDALGIMSKESMAKARKEAKKAGYDV